MNDQAALLEIRRYLHAHPELSGHEQRTAALVAGSCVNSAGRCVKVLAARVWWPSWALRTAL